MTKEYLMNIINFNKDIIPDSELAILMNYIDYANMSFEDTLVYERYAKIKYDKKEYTNVEKEMYRLYDEIERLITLIDQKEDLDQEFKDSQVANCLFIKDMISGMYRNDTLTENDIMLAKNHIIIDIAPKCKLKTNYHFDNKHQLLLSLSPYAWNYQEHAKEESKNTRERV